MEENKDISVEVQEPASKTEEQIRAEVKAEYEKIADKRVADALKKREKKLTEQLNKEREAKEKEDADKKAEFAKVDNTKEREIIAKSLKLAIVDALQDMGLSPSLRGLVMVEDLISLPDEEKKEKLTERFIGAVELFRNEVERQIQTEKKEFLRGNTPRIGNAEPLSPYDYYKKAGNVEGMISEKFRAYYEEND